MAPSTAIVWFRRDLRLHDHPALAAATAEHELVVPLFVVDESLVGGRFASPNRTWFMLESVRALGEGLADLGAPLVVRTGDPRTLVPELARQLGAADVYVSREHAPYGRERDRVVADALAPSGGTLHAKRGVLVHEPEEMLNSGGDPFSVFSPFRRAWETRPRRGVVDAPIRLIRHPVEPGALPSLRTLGLGDGPTADPDLMPEPGETAARARLDRWLDGGIDRYDGTRDRLGVDGGTSRLSQDLHLGLLSPLEVVERASGPGAGRRTFVNELVWREFYAHVLFHRPDVRRSSFRREFERLPYSADAPAIEAWRVGRTGYPVVDAAMRQLAATGWMHNRARMVAASFLTKHLLVDWRTGEAHFMRHLTDGDVASNNGGWQWSSSTGTDPQPYFRVFNPTLQGRKFDPDGAYVRRWVPELARVPTARIHTPWELTRTEQEVAGCVIARDYPAPIVEHLAARNRALEVYEAARRAS
jgi:deoxyribodipyrimidine photo-lyase